MSNKFETLQTNEDYSMEEVKEELKLEIGLTDEKQLDLATKRVINFLEKEKLTLAQALSQVKQELSEKVGYNNFPYIVDADGVVTIKRPEDNKSISGGENTTFDDLQDEVEFYFSKVKDDEKIKLMTKRADHLMREEGLEMHDAFNRVEAEFRL